MTIVKKHKRRTNKGYTKVKQHKRKVRKKFNPIYRKMNHQRKLNRQSAQRIDSWRDRLGKNVYARDDALKIHGRIDTEKEDIKNRSRKILYMEKML